MRFARGTAAAVMLCWASIGHVGANATPPPSCDIVSPGFAVTYDPTSDVGKSSVGKLELSCSSTVPLTIQVDLSQGRSGDYFDRTMGQIGGGGVLHYNLLFGTSNTPFGDGSPGTQHVQATASPAGGEIAISQSIRLVLAPHQFAVPGRYSDAVMVTVQF